MRIKIKHNLQKPLILPIAYHHILQSIIYKSIMKTDGYEDLHEEGYKYNNRQFRMFVFSDISGPYLISDKKIIFYDEIYWFFSSCDDDLVLNVKDSIEKNGIHYNDQFIKKVDCEIQKYNINSNELLINMISPVVIYQTSELDRKKIYYSPYDYEFYELFKDNFIRKYTAYHGDYPDSVPDIEIINMKEKDKCVTNFKGTLITGYKGVFLLRGEIDHLDFLYNVGIGSNNSQGFGMIEIMGDR